MKILKFLWNTLSFIRALVFNVFFVFLLFVIIAVAIPVPEKPLPAKTALWIAPKGVLVDERTFNPSLVDLFNTSPQDQETLVGDLTKAITSAAFDSRIEAVVLDLNYLQGGGITKILEVGRALEKFKEQGKPIVAYADSMSQQQYLLAAFADTIILNELGSTFLTGFGSYREYIQEATQKLKLDFHIFRVGTHKDAVEPLIRNSMSEQSKEHNRLWVSELWQTYMKTIERLREIGDGSINEYVVSQYNAFPESALTGAQFAKEAKLVDVVLSKVELRNYLLNQFGESEEPDQPNGVSLNRYLAELDTNILLKTQNIGLIIAQGTILDGNQPAGSIGGESLSRMIRQAGNDESVQALMIRIDSGGGSAFASEVVRQEIIALRNKGLPVYVSMGSVAASGGYWIAAGADKIWAMPTTITGSIGVWGVYPNLTKTFESIGIYTDGVGSTELSNTFIPTMPLGEPARRIFQAGVEDIYSQFLNIVAQARGMTTSQVNDVAQGRVWTGTKALELGLIDNLGSTQDAIKAMAIDFNIENYRVKRITPELSVKEQIMHALMQQSSLVTQKIQTQVLGTTPSLIVSAVEESAVGSALSQTLAINKTKKLSVLAQCMECLVQ